MVTLQICLFKNICYLSHNSRQYVLNYKGFKVFVETKCTFFPARHNFFYDYGKEETVNSPYYIVK